jgi:methyl-accepting chemotaxis protein
LYAGRHLAAELLGLKQRQMASREVADQLIRSVLEAHPEFTGIGTVWEANAFDGKDSEYAGKPGHDASGRYIPYWNRGNGTVQVEALTDYEKEGRVITIWFRKNRSGIPDGTYFTKSQVKMCS